MIDTHCHLTHPRLANQIDEIVERAREAGLEACLTIGTGIDDGRRAAALMRRYPGFVYCSAGIDPFSANELGASFDAALDELGALLREESFVALGEIGLDFHYDLDPPRVQTERFERQLNLAVELDLPVVIHVREAHEPMARVLEQHPRNRGVIHSFTAGPGEAERYLELGFSLAFNGVLTFRNAEEVRQAALVTPAERLLVETDSPYLAPVPLRGRRCEPAYVAHTIARLAEVRGEAVEQIVQRTSANARALLFGEAAEPG